MRIIGGKNSRKVLNPPAGLPVRPTTDMAKEALFNILNNHVDFEDLRVLDLFAGTGNISFEFASRGAIEVIAVDNYPACIDYIRKIAGELHFDNLVAIKSDVARFLNNCRTHFDLIFADPPYDMKEAGQVPEWVFDSKLLAEGGWLVLEHGSYRSYKSHPAFFDERKYGKVHFSFFTMASE